jgi:hypothetical protein
LNSILYYVSGHGYGHAVRSSQVIHSLKQLRPDLKIHVRTTAPEWLFPASVFHSRRSIDVGIAQRDSLDMDLDATLQACGALHANANQLVDQELGFVRDNQVQLIVGDIPPLCFEIAARAAISSVAITNFTWDTIYRAYLSRYPDFAPIVAQMEDFYGQATVALTLPYPCDMNVFSRREAIPWIARASALTKKAARAKLELPTSAIIVLLSFGGLGLSRLPLDRLKQLQEFFFVGTGESKKQDANLLILPNAQSQYQDLVRAVDIIVTKPGYGIVADVLAHKVPTLYTDRGEFPEYPFLVQALEDLATAQFIPQTELLSGNIAPYLNRLLSKEPNWPEVCLDGARIAAGKIFGLVDRYQ